MQKVDMAQKTVKIKQLLPIVKKELEERGEEPKLPISSLPDFNKKIWGLKVGLTTIGARTSQGKSSIALQFAHDLASKGNEVLFLSLEMTVENMIERLFCNIKMVDNTKLQQGYFSKDTDIQLKWKAFEEEITKIPLLITCGIGQTFQEVVDLFALLNPKPKAIFIDYIQGSKLGLHEREMLNEYIRYFRELCLKNNIAGVICSQVNRKVNEETKEPSMDCLKGTGTLEEHSDIVLLLHWENFYTHVEDNFNKFKIMVAKNRNGMTGNHYVYYAPKHYKFTDTWMEKTEPIKENWQDGGDR